MRRMITMLVAMATLIALGVPAASASEDEDVYLSLGTSLAAGSMADAAGNTTFSSNKSYTNQLFRKLKRNGSHDLEHVKLGCAGETTETFVGGVDLYGDPTHCAASYETGTQLGDALETIADGNVVLVTIDIGANDLIQAQISCAGDPNCVAAAVPGIATRTAEIVGALRAAGYAGEILAMNYYNPQVAAAIGFFPGVPGQQSPDPVVAGLSDLLVQGANAAQAQAYELFDVDVVDVFSEFNAGDFGDDDPSNGVPDNVDVVCTLSFMCPADPLVKPNIHLNRKGYKVVANAFFDQIG